MVNKKLKRPKTRLYSTIESERLEWLWKNRIPLGKLTLLIGDPDIGKSVLTMFIASRVTTGEDWPDGRNGKKGSVVVLNVEDDLTDTIRPRLEAAGADLEKVIDLKIERRLPNSDEYKSSPMYDLLKDIDMLEEVVRERKDVRLVIIDPITAFMGGGNANNNADVRNFLAPLAFLASKHNLSIVGISHLNKKTDIPANYRTLGSIGFVAAARAGLSVMKDPKDEDRRFLLPSKGNLSKSSSGLVFTLEEKMLKTTSGDKTFPMVYCSFTGEVVNDSFDEVLEQSKETPPPSPVREAEKWLSRLFTSSPSFSAKELLRMAEENGIKERTLMRAKKNLNITSVREDRGWYWRMEKREKKSSRMMMNSEGGFQIVGNVKTPFLA